MTDEEFEQWWEGLDRLYRVPTVLDYLDAESYWKALRLLDGWPLAGFLLEYARTHKPPDGHEGHPVVSEILLAGNSRSEKLGYHAYLWGWEAEAPTGPEAVSKAFVKAHKVTR